MSCKAPKASVVCGSFERARRPSARTLTHAFRWTEGTVSRGCAFIRVSQLETDVSSVPLPHRIKSWLLTSLQHRLMKTGGRLVKHARYYWLLLAEGHLNRRLFRDMPRRIWEPPVPGV